jgi:aminoglycoside phosphotransferase (APT) family kinase protein
MYQTSESVGLRPDAAWLQERLGEELWRNGERPGDVVKVRMIRRRVSAKGHIKSLYRVTLRRCDNTLLEQTYVGSEFPTEALRAEYDSWLSKATIEPAMGRAVILIPEANLMLLAFPNNRQMQVLDNDDLTAWLTRRATALAGQGDRRRRWRLGDVAMQLMQYHPGQRLTVRCRGSFVAEDGTHQPFAYIAKQFRKHKRARSVYRNLRWLGTHLNGSSSLRLPRAVAFDRESGLVVMEEMPGAELEQMLDALDLDRVMPRVGKMLASFHQVPRRVRKTISRRSELEKIRSAAKTIGSVVPSLLDRAETCVTRCRKVRWADDMPGVMLHGAFRPKHVFIDGGALGLIDVDGIRMGHPAYDLAEFLSALHFLETQGHISEEVRRTAAHRFLAGYAAHASWVPPPSAVLWFLATHLLHKHARTQSRCLDESRETKVCHLLMLAETALRGCEELRGEPSLEAIWRIMP